MTHTCSRCNKVFLQESNSGLCDRCQDILEFGYQSFPAYLLEEKNTNQVEPEEKKLVLAQ